MSRRWDDPGSCDEARKAMVQQLERELRPILKLRGDAGLCPEVSRAMLKVPRDRFVPASEADAAYDDRPLYIGHGQTISAPLIVALMTHLLQVAAQHRVLEVGTGSGYQAAVLAEIVAEIYSVETVASLGEAAAQRLRTLGYRNVSVRVGDGNLGWQEHAPYDGIIVTAAGPAIPAPLIAQLRPGARLVMPVGEHGGSQWLEVLHKDAAGTTRRERIIPVSFVPLVDG